jgi:hypothetical protein
VKTEATFGWTLAAARASRKNEAAPFIEDIFR